MNTLSQDTLTVALLVKLHFRNRGLTRWSLHTMCLLSASVLATVNGGWKLVFMGIFLSAFCISPPFEQ